MSDTGKSCYCTGIYSKLPPGNSSTLLSNIPNSTHLLKCWCASTCPLSHIGIFQSTFDSHVNIFCGKPPPCTIHTSSIPIFRPYLTILVCNHSLFHISFSSICTWWKTTLTYVTIHKAHIEIHHSWFYMIHNWYNTQFPINHNIKSKFCNAQ